VYDEEVETGNKSKGMGKTDLYNSLAQELTVGGSHINTTFSPHEINIQSDLPLGSIS
jgi:hypothetical protein